MNYSELAVQADISIKQAGATFTAKKIVSVFDPVTQTSENTFTTYNINAVILPLKRIREGQAAEVEYVSGDTTHLVLHEVSEILISAAEEVNNHDEVLVRGEWWLLKGLNKLSPDGSTVIIYKAYLQRK